MTAGSFIVTCIIIYIVYRFVNSLNPQPIQQGVPKGKWMFHPMLILFAGVAFLVALLVYPPVTWIRKGLWMPDRNAWIAYIPSQYAIDWTVLIVEALIIICITAFLYYFQIQRLHQLANNGTPNSYRMNNFSTDTGEPTIAKDWSLSGIQAGGLFNLATVKNIFGKLEEHRAIETDANGMKIPPIDTYKFSRGFIKVQQNKIVYLHSAFPGICTPRGIVIGRSTVHDVISAYGTKISQTKRVPDRGNHVEITGYTYRQGTSYLIFFVNQNGLVVMIHVSL